MLLDQKPEKRTNLGDKSLILGAKSQTWEGDTDGQMIGADLLGLIGVIGDMESGLRRKAPGGIETDGQILINTQ